MGNTQTKTKKKSSSKGNKTEKGRQLTEHTGPDNPELSSEGKEESLIKDLSKKVTIGG